MNKQNLNKFNMTGFRHWVSTLVCVNTEGVVVGDVDDDDVVIKLRLIEKQGNRESSGSPLRGKSVPDWGKEAS